eukprot:CAMPEP_0174275422 /NCGR_PEP_ID=MMETSP0439-20130205/59816_1 /TAXON_ID=0 /ORGANISM="Stereomyxa ramosa, Strain Chinc5" /LENGTH=175 /DNA_ID=CAMNT_0015367523 /DNA_START=269 /DNA_END=793 /DNA_ORIENTATION=-
MKAKKSACVLEFWQKSMAKGIRWPGRVRKVREKEVPRGTLFVSSTRSPLGDKANLGLFSAATKWLSSKYFNLNLSPTQCKILGRQSQLGIIFSSNKVAFVQIFQPQLVANTVQNPPNVMRITGNVSKGVFVMLFVLRLLPRPSPLLQEVPKPTRRNFHMFHHPNKPANVSGGVSW